MARQVALALASLRLQDRLLQQSTRDPLTGLLNRAAFFDAYARSLSLAERERRPMTLVMLDLVPFDPMAWWDRLAKPLRPATHHAHSATTHREVTLLGAFTLGASSGFIASPCTTPVLTAILAFIANTMKLEVK